MNELSEKRDGTEVVARSNARENGRALTRNVSGCLSDAQWTIVNVCVRAAQALGAPRSYGEIFGFIFCSTQPVSFEDVVRVLRLSSGTASQGLRHLKRLGAVRTCYLAQDRRDHYIAETSLHKVMSSYFAENIFAHLGSSEQQLTEMRAASSHVPGAPSVLAEIDLLLAWNQQMRRAIHAAAAALG